MFKGFYPGRAGLPMAVLSLFLVALCLPSLGLANAPEPPQETDKGKKRLPRLRRGRKARPPTRGVSQGPTLRKSSKERPFPRRSEADSRKMEEQLAMIADLRRDLGEKGKEVETLTERIKNMSETSTPGEMASKLQELATERDRLRDELENQKSAFEAEIEDLKSKLNAAAGAAGGIDLSEVIAERDAALQERDDLKAELDGGKVIRGQMERQLQELSREKATWDQKLKPLETAKAEAEQDLAAVTQERDALKKERDDLQVKVKNLDAEVDQAEQQASLAQQSGKSAEELRAELTGEDGAITLAAADAGRAKLAALVGLFAGLGGIGLGVFLLFTLRHLRYDVAVAQAQSGGGIDPAEVEQIISARISDIAGDMPTLGAGGDVEGMVGEQVKKAVSSQIKSEAFQNKIKQVVAQAVPKGGGGGGGGGGLSPQDVKIMVDNQFRAITTYLKNEAVPKMVEDALKKKG